MLLDIAFAFLAILGYFVAILMASKTTKAQNINLILGENDIDQIAQKVVDKLQMKLKGYTHLGNDILDPGNEIIVDESPIVIRSKIDGLSLEGEAIGEVKETTDKIDISKLAVLKKGSKK